jgi:protein-S-isoprenylcysteine O-methyltransferase Ste14
LEAAILSMEVIWAGTLVWSILRPDERIWPPGVRGNASWWVTWVLTIMILSGLVALAWQDRGSLSLPPFAQPLGALLIILGFPFGLWGVLTLGWSASSGEEHHLVVSGPYRFSRNPQYVSDLALLTGLALLSASATALIPIAGASLWFLLAPFAEEPWLKDLYGEAYLAYCATVRRFL